MPQGRVVRSHSNIYYVLVDGRELECRPRGKLRLAGIGVLAGDLVEVTLQEGAEARIDRILPRRSVLQRPAVANVDQAVIVFTMAEPVENLLLLDRFLFHAEGENVDVVIAVNKVDLLAPARVAEFVRAYRQVGYSVVPVSAREAQGMGDLLKHLQDKTSVLAGQSGVGKSRIMQALVPGGVFKVGELTAKLARGKHTTRHVELLPLPQGGFLADTPGFTHLIFDWMEPIKVQERFPELRELRGQCRFDDCLHKHEPDCAVRRAVDAGTILRSRYAHYLEFMTEINHIQRW